MTDHTHPTAADENFDDEQLLEELRRAGELDAPPAEMFAAAKALFSLRTLDAELAELTYDSVHDERALAGAGLRRGAMAGRFLTFEAPGLTVEVEAVVAGTGRRLMGQLVPPKPTRIEVRQVSGSVTVTADEMGRFSVDDLSPGPVSLRCEGVGDAAPTITDWVLV